MVHAQVATTQAGSDMKPSLFDMLKNPFKSSRQKSPQPPSIADKPPLSPRSKKMNEYVTSSGASTPNSSNPASPHVSHKTFNDADSPIICETYPKTPLKLNSPVIAAQKAIFSTPTTSGSPKINHRSQIIKNTIVHSMSTENSTTTRSTTNNYSRSVSVNSSSSTSSTTDSRLKAISSQKGFALRCDFPEDVDVNDLQKSPKEVHIEEKKYTTSSKTKVIRDGITAEKIETTDQQLKKVQAGDMSYQEAKHNEALQARMEGDGFSAEKLAATRQDKKHLKIGDIVHEQHKSSAAGVQRLTTAEGTTQELDMMKQNSHRVFNNGVLEQQQKFSEASATRTVFDNKGVIKSNECHSETDNGGGSPIVSEPDDLCLPMSPQHLAITQGVCKDLEIFHQQPTQSDVKKAIAKFSEKVEQCVEKLKKAETESESIEILDTMVAIIRKAWSVPTYGHDLGFAMCNILRKTGALDVLLANCSEDKDQSLKFASARMLEQCLSTENRAYVVKNGLENVVKVACDCSATKSTSEARVGTGILCHLFKHSEETCSNLIRMGGLKAILFECRAADVETLRHCATALANLSLYGGPENHQQMIKHKAPMWLFPLAFNPDDNIRYYACLAISALVANKEIEAAVMRSGTLDLVEPFVTSRNPEEFAKSTVAHVHGQSKDWLLRFVPVLDSKREEAKSLAAFHFAMEAGIKKRQGNTSIFAEIGALEALKKVASSPNAIASKYAAQALQIIGETVPHQLSQQVPLWTVDDVIEWVKQIGFASYTQQFKQSRVDGDLLLQLDEEMLRDDIGIQNGILRRRFLREMSLLKQMADYSSVDSTNVNQVLQGISSEFSQYTYQMLKSSVDTDSLSQLTDDQLLHDCGIDNSIHRLRIIQATKNNRVVEEEQEKKHLDVFISYRRSNGSQLASLLKVHLQLRGFSVFLDVERLEAGQFDNNLLNSIRQAKYFLLVLTPNALDRCASDHDRKDWVHKEIVEALQSACNIIPILDNFNWPDQDQLPEDMRAISRFNGIRWIHDYQDACVDKLERFMRGESVASTTGSGKPIPRNTIYQRSPSNDSEKCSTRPQSPVVTVHAT